VSLLASVLPVVQAEPIVRLLFERGQFGADATERVSQALAFLAPGLVAFSAVNILARAFFAVGDTRTPMKISVFCLCVNALLSAALIVHLRQRGPGLANTLTAWLNAGLLLYAFRRKMPKLEFDELRRQLPRLGVAVAVAGSVAWGLTACWESRLGHASLWLKLGEVLTPALAAALAYLGLALLFRIPAAREVLRLSPSGKS
jgi:putative peptidoglycan lipid II flippase